MKVFWLALLAVIFIFSISNLIQIFKSKASFFSLLVRLSLMSLFRLVFYACYVISKNNMAALGFLSLYYILAPWLLFMVIEIIAVFSAKEKSLSYTISKYAFIVLITLDSLSLIINNYRHHVFSLTAKVLEEKVLYWVQYNYLFFNIHLVLCYLLASVVLIELLRNLIRESKIYRARYAYLFVFLLLSLVITLVFMFVPCRYDPASLIYSVCVNIYVYSVICLIPRTLVEKMMGVVSENIKYGVICFDIDGKCIYINKLGRNIFKTNVYGNEPVEAYRHRIVAERKENLEETFQDTFQLDGDKHIFDVYYKNFYDKKGICQGSYFKFDDRTEDIKNLEEETYNASYDKLTGLLNKKTFFEKVAETIKNEPEFERYLVATDIENFKLLNELFGIETGDKVLQTQAKYLKEIKYPGALLGRVGGDRFAILIPKMYFKPELAVLNTKRIQECLLGLEYKLHIYIGVYEITDPEENVMSMYDKACLAIREIFGSYELTLSYYDNNILQKSLYENKIISGFNEALEKKQFIMFLQPQINGENGKIMGAEALVRWNHADFGLLDPRDFIKILERSDVIFQMDKIVWEMACEKLRDWKNKGRPDLCISVNISSKDFYYGDLYKIFTSLVEEYEISPANLYLEVNESSIIQDAKFHKNIIDKLRSYGFKLEMDDFGSGYSSLASLRIVQMDVLKIDMNVLTKDFNPDEKHQKLLQLLINLAKQLDMSVIAEGVETERQFEFLQNAGCQIFQGYLFSKPLAVSLFEEKYILKGKKC